VVDFDRDFLFYISCSFGSKEAKRNDEYCKDPNSRCWGIYLKRKKKNRCKETEELEVDTKEASSTGNIIYFFSTELRTLLLLSCYEFGTSKER
jgi:hypothetical protein